MNDLPQPTETKRELTYPVPHVLLKYEQSDGDPPVIQVRMGGSKQIEHTTTIEYSDTPVDESAQVFAIRAKNRVNVAGVTLEVLNDKITGEKPIAPSAPTASDYMAKVGKPVMIYFSCVGDRHTSQALKRPAFRTVRVKIVLP